MATRAEQRTAKAQREADKWNAEHSVGTIVRYWRGVRRYQDSKVDEPPSGEGRVRHEATVVCESAVAWIEGCSGCVALTHVEAVKATVA